MEEHILRRLLYSTALLLHGSKHAEEGNSLEGAFAILNFDNSVEMLMNTILEYYRVPYARERKFHQLIETTVSLYLNRKLVEIARKRRLKLSRVTEQAPSSILDYLEPQNNQKSSDYPSQSSLSNKFEWTEGDLNPRLPPCGGGDHTGLIYRPN